MILAVTGLGLRSALGEEPEAVSRALSGGESGLVEVPGLRELPTGANAGIVNGLEVRTWLKKRKDRKLLSRAAALSLVVAGEALGDWPGNREELGLFWGVGREPPDDGECERSLAASCEGGRLREELLATKGRDVYPPLLPLKTLPNMSLAHISINLGIGGENATYAGWAVAGLQAVLSGIWAVREGRSPAALVGAGDSLVDLGNARDRLRLGRTGPPGEAAGAMLIEPLDSAWKRNARIHCLIEVEPDGRRPAEERRGLRQHHEQLGDCGAADGAVSLVLAAAIVRTQARNLSILDGEDERSRQGVRLRQPGSC